MRNLIYYLLAVAFLALPGCSSDDDGGDQGPSTGELILFAIIGDWDSSSATFTTTNANPVMSRDVVADGGSCDLSVSQDQRFALVIRNPGTPNPQITTGQLVADGNFINVRFDSDPDVDVRWDFTLSGDNLTITGPLNYDFESDGTFEETTATMLFVPN